MNVPSPPPRCDHRRTIRIEGAGGRVSFGRLVVAHVEWCIDCGTALAKPTTPSGDLLPYHPKRAS